MVFERGADEPELETEDYEELDSRKYGAACVWFLRFRR